MPNSNDISVRILDAAVADAIAAAQWDRIDLQTRRPGQDPKDLLLAKAAEETAVVSLKEPGVFQQYFAGSGGTPHPRVLAGYRAA